MGLRVYGIKNCNTVKKALTWLEENNLPYTFHDYKKEPATLQQLKAWEKKVPWESLVNKKGTTWRKLSPAEQAEVIDTESANKVLLSNNSMIKRPLIESTKGIILGFDENEYQAKLK
ncbi:ArsC family reductase [Sphingobacterium arenae]|uniref:ArsC family reductase n=1 Tax=Sphingobacterium arenae TaxID=1280598 RepID=A0ABR7Y644_9SPHI|nr:ArsC family reductase [Sphingobacterium arenae]MBD1426774.1 ArsC family reductase [Sphingobacterium arenae]